LRAILILLLLCGCTSTTVEDDDKSTLKIYQEDGSYTERSLEDHRGDNLMEVPEFPKSDPPLEWEGNLDKAPR